LKVLPTDVPRSSEEISTFFQEEILELQNSDKKVLRVTVGVQVQGAPVPPAWKKALEAFSNGTTLMEFYEHVEGELGASSTGRQRRIGERNLRRRKHSQFLSTLKRLADRGILTLRPSSFLDEAGNLTWPDMDSMRSKNSENTRKGWAKEISAVWVKPNLKSLKKETGSQASWTEKRTITLRRKGEGVGNIIVEGLVAKPIHLMAGSRSERAESPVSSEREKSDEVRGRAADDGYHSGEG
jgi:hypothetical protein